MIVVIGLPAYSETPDPVGAAAGLAVDIAAAARSRGAAVELVGKIGDDGAGDAVVLGLGRLGVGHAALLRDPARPTPVLVTDAAAAGETGGDVGPDTYAADEEVEPAGAHMLPEDAGERPGMDAGDIALGLRYLAEARVVVVAEQLAEAAMKAVVDGATFSDARLVVLLPAGAVAPVLPANATLLEEPADDDGSFARLVGQYAAALDAGEEPSAAFAEAVAGSGWEAVRD